MVEVLEQMLLTFVRQPSCSQHMALIFGLCAFATGAKWRSLISCSSVRQPAAMLSNKCRLSASADWLLALTSPLTCLHLLLLDWLIYWLQSADPLLLVVLLMVVLWSGCPASGCLFFFFSWAFSSQGKLLAASLVKWRFVAASLAKYVRCTWWLRLRVNPTHTACLGVFNFFKDHF